MDFYKRFNFYRDSLQKSASNGSLAKQVEKTFGGGFY